MGAAPARALHASLGDGFCVSPACSIPTHSIVSEATHTPLTLAQGTLLTAPFTEPCSTMGPFLPSRSHEHIPTFTRNYPRITGSVSLEKTSAIFESSLGLNTTMPTDHGTECHVQSLSTNISRDGDFTPSLDSPFQSLSDEIHSCGQQLWLTLPVLS